MADKQTRAAGPKQNLYLNKELEYWAKNAAKIRSRNIKTGLAFGAFTIGIFAYTILSVKQERILDELDEEARIRVVRGPQTGANS